MQFTFTSQISLENTRISIIELCFFSNGWYCVQDALTFHSSHLMLLDKIGGAASATANAADGAAAGAAADAAAAGAAADAAAGAATNAAAGAAAGAATNAAAGAATTTFIGCN